ncbi:hypothetical protein TNCV_4759351 [Trichonephila clavipes]|nr:hypothetical protein TNCV_4759351 [Trichonephila clavipes]
MDPCYFRCCCVVLSFIRFIVDRVEFLLHGSHNLVIISSSASHAIQVPTSSSSHPGINVVVNKKQQPWSGYLTLRIIYVLINDVYCNGKGAASVDPGTWGTKRRRLTAPSAC